MGTELFDNSDAVDLDDVRPGDASAPPEQNTALHPDQVKQLQDDRAEAEKNAKDAADKKASGETGPTGSTGASGPTGASYTGSTGSTGI